MKRTICAVLSLLLLVIVNFGFDVNTDTVEVILGEFGNDGFYYDAIPDIIEYEDSTNIVYDIAFVSDAGGINDNTFNRTIYNGIKRYAYENDKNYKYFPEKSIEYNSYTRAQMLTDACNSGAKIVVVAGYSFGEALSSCAKEHSNIDFVFVDGYVLKADDKALENVFTVKFTNEESGFLAGYAAVCAGYTKLGFAGGGNGNNPNVCEYGYGFTQGVALASQRLNVKSNLNISWCYGNNYSESDELKSLINGLYSTGTQAVFACGGTMYVSALESGEYMKGKVIVADSDIGESSDSIIICACKNLRGAVEYGLKTYFEGNFNAIGGKSATLGIFENGVGLGFSNWKLADFSVNDYKLLVSEIKNGKIRVDGNYTNFWQREYDNLTITEIK